MNEEHVKALFLLADIPVIKFYPIPNEYMKARNDPWWLVVTQFGILKVGWRKRVIHIEWEGTRLRIVITQDEVTKTETCVHAWSYSKAVEYLTTIGRVLKRLPVLVHELVDVPKHVAVNLEEVASCSSTES